MRFTYPSGRSKIIQACALTVFLTLTSFFPKPPTPPCNPFARPFSGYTFIRPDIINRNAAYAPFFVQWDDYYDRNYFSRDIQKEENINEWIGRFCDQADPKDVEYIVYKAGFSELASIRTSAVDTKKLTPLPAGLSRNTFAEMLALNGCTEVIDYLIFAKKCEPYVVTNGDGWTQADRDVPTMLQLIEEGRGRFKDTDSHFVKLRYAYQIVRLAHYAGDWKYTVDLYNFLLPKIDRQKASIVFYWMVGHLAGALQQMGQPAEAAYRYSLVFRYCPSKRTQAFRSFKIRNDAEWKATLALCQNDAERATLYVLRAGGSHSHAVEDMQTIYDLDPKNPQLDLLLISDVQQLEKIFLRTRVTDQKHGTVQGMVQREGAATHLLDLQKLISRVLSEGQAANPTLWRALSGYLELLAGDRYAADKSFQRASTLLDKSKTDDQHLAEQIAEWRILMEILNLDPSREYVDQQAFRIRSYEGFKANPDFEYFLQDWLSTAYAAAAHPGKAILAAYPPSALGYNPRLDVLNDLLKAADEPDPVLLETTMEIDTNPDQIRARLLEMKGAFLMSQGEMEAALTTFRKITPIEASKMVRFSPFKEVFDEKVNRPLTDTLLLNRRQIVEQILTYEFKAKAAEAEQNPVAAWYYYLIGLSYYNMSYFGYEWEAMDYYRSGYNWLRLAQGPEFPLRNSPDGNRENIDVSRALSYFERALHGTQSPELAARATFLAARCQQKQWFSQPDTRYRPGSKLIPTLPDNYRTYYDLLISKYAKTEFYGQMVKECKWLEAYGR